MSAAWRQSSEAVPDSASDTMEGEEPVLSPDQLAIRDEFNEEYFDILDTLPHDLRRNYDLMREAEQQWTLTRSSLHSSLKLFLSDSIPPKQKNEQLTAILQTTNHLIRSCEDKRSLALTMQSWVRRHALRLERDIVAMEESALLGLKPGTHPSHAAPSLEPPPPLSPVALTLAPNDRRLTQPRPRSIARGRGRSRKSGGGRKKPPPPSSPAKQILEEDEDNRKYCYCHQVAWGDMVGCDNPDCANEWFHTKCAQVTLEQVEGKKWFCRDCTHDLMYASTQTQRKLRAR